MNDGINKRTHHESRREEDLGGVEAGETKSRQGFFKYLATSTRLPVEEDFFPSDTSYKQAISPGICRDLFPMQYSSYEYRY